MYSCPENLLPSVFVVAITVLYALLVTKSRRVDRRERKKAGHIFLHDSAPPSHQLYAVVVDTGFRAPARFTAKVPGRLGDTCGVDRVCVQVWVHGSNVAIRLSICPGSSREDSRTRTKQESKAWKERRLVPGR